MKKKLLSTLLCVAMVASLVAGCGAKETPAAETQTPATEEAETPAAEEEKNEAGFSVTMGKYGDNKNPEAAEEGLARIAAYADVPFEWDLLENAKEQIQLRMASGDYPDAVMGNYFSAQDVSNYASLGILVPLDEYINETDTPNIYKLFQEHPEVAAANKLEDGHMYSMPQYIGREAQFLETALWINKTWLDNLGLEVPKTLDDLYEVLKAFKTGDPNGNGKADEIPMSFANGSGYSYPEALLSCFGISTKHGGYDGFTTIEDGVCSFSPEREEWKELMKFYNKLYNEGLLDMECFTQDYNQFLAKLASEESIVGFLTFNSNPMQNADEYIAIEPIHAEGYEACWHLNPGVIGVRNLFSVTTACENPAAAMRWLDKFYSPEESLKNMYGDVGRTFTIDDKGVWQWNEPEEGKTFNQMITENTIVSGPAAVTEEMIETMLGVNPQWAEMDEIYNTMYKQHADDENWPRPYYTNEESGRYSELSTDLFSFVNERKAEWITGKPEAIDAEWDEYLKDLEALGSEEFITINQAAYDRTK